MKHLIERLRLVLDESFLHWLVHEFDDSVLVDTLLEAAPKKKITPAQAKKKFNVSGKLQPPYYLINPKTMPIPDSADMWWKGVAKAYNEGKISMGAGRSKSYMWSMRYWKNQFRVKYGFRPKRTKDKAMMEQIWDRVRQASNIMGLELQKPKNQQVKGRISMAARLIRAVRTTKGMARKVDEELGKNNLTFKQVEEAGK